MIGFTSTVIGLALALISPAIANDRNVPVLSAPPSGQPATAFPGERGLAKADFPRVIKLAKDIYAYEDLRAPGFTTVSMFVVGTHGVLVADGQEDPTATRRLLTAIKSVTRQPVRWYVVGSDHADHTGGNSVLPQGVRYIVHPRSQDALRREAADAKTGELPVIVPGEAMRGTNETIDVGGHTVRVLYLGPAHTGGDLMVQLPDAGVLFMSEVFLNRVFPAMRTAQPSDWLAVVDAALRMNARLYVPGHGFVENGPRSREELIEFRRAMQHVIAEGRRLHALGLSPEVAVKRANWGPYAKWMLADTQRIVAIRQVYAEIEGTMGK